jgi:hypothetical protein
VTRTDLSFFATLADSRWGLGVNVAGLYGFWRPGAPLVKDAAALWPLLLAAMLGVVAWGIAALSRRGPSGRALGVTCAAVVVLGLLLALGAQGPTGGAYVFLFRHLPGFKVMREPQKFLALVALGYSVGFGAGAEALCARARAWARPVALVVLAATPILYGYTELWGFDGSARPAAYPRDWAGAQAAIAPGTTSLAVPWSAYLPVPWLGGAVVANPLADYFSGPVISGDNLQAGPIETESTNPRSRFLIFALAEGPSLHEFGRDLAALGARDVVLAKTGAWHDFDWLNRQRDLRRVFDGPTIEVFASDEVVPTAYEPRATLRLRDWGAVLALAERAPLVDYLIHVAHAGPGPLALPPALSRAAPGPPRVLSVTPTFPVAQSFRASAGARDVVLTLPDNPGWTAPGFATTSQFGVTVALSRAGAARAGAVTARYGPFGVVEAWDAVGAALLALDLAAAAAFARRSRRRRPASPPAPGAAPGG